MAEKLGYENLKKLGDVGLELGNVLGAVLEKDAGKEKWMRAFDLVDELAGLSGVKWDQLDDEYKDLSEDELRLWKKHAMEKLDLPQDKAEAHAEDAMDLARHMLSMWMVAVKIYDRASDKE